MTSVPRSLATLLVLTVVGTIASAQTTGAIRGTVIADDGLPLENVEIVVRGVERTVLTNATGAYRFNDVPVGQQVVTARRPGYVASEATVVVAAGQVAVADFQLSPVPQQLDSIEVTGDRIPPFLLGNIHDTFGRPLEGVEIVLEGVTRTVRTSARGTFRFDSLEAKRYQLTARLPGFVAARNVIEVKAGPPTEVAMRLNAFAQVLETVEVDADLRGLYGVVATREMQPVPGAKVTVFGGGMTQVTDSAGRFAFPDIKPGDYLVGAARDGMEGKPILVDMNRGRRIEVVVTLVPENPSRGRVIGARWINHDMGLALSFQPSWKRMNRGDLARFEGRQLCDIGRIRMEARGTEATLIVDGVQALNPWSLCAFNADEVAMITFTGGCTVRGIRIFPPPGMRCFQIWTR